MSRPTRRKKSPRTRRTPRRRFSITVWLQLFAIVASVSASWLLWLDYRIHHEFEGRRWLIPARVFARPFEIYTGQQLSRSEIEDALIRSRYVSADPGTGSGNYRIMAEGIQVHLREFDYWDGPQAAGQVRIGLRDNRVSAVINPQTGEDIGYTRIDPVLIGKIYPDHNEDRVLVGPEEVPSFLIDALIAVEDRNFYRHPGIDLRGIARAMWVNLRSGEFTQGGSTLTQQLVKNYFLTRERTLTRKFNELWMSLLLERRYSKEEILNAYLNEVYLGQNGARAIHGFGTAAEFYFGRPLSELREDQLALLAGLVRGASYYNPRREPERARSRRNTVLDLLVAQDYLAQENATALKQRPLDILASARNITSQYPAYLDLVRRQLLEDYELDDLKNDGLQIHTTLDPSLQDRLDRRVLEQTARLESSRQMPTGTLEAAVVIVNPVTGEVLALNGGRDATVGGFNRALDARRPVGSLIKPFIYMTALVNSARYHVLSQLADEPVNLQQDDGSIWSPDNYDHKAHGEVTLLEAFANSYNLATVALGRQVGLSPIIETLVKAGLGSDIKPYPSLLLGALDASPLAVTQAYQAIANGGYRTPLNSLREVLDAQGQPLQRRELRVESVFNEQAAFQMTWLMHQVTRMGTAKRLPSTTGSSAAIAGKTGTTNESRDSWFAGFGDDMLTVVWVGRDDNRPTPFTGASGAMVIWADIMRDVRYTPLGLLAPPGVNFTDGYRVRFEGLCVDPGQIPYVGPEPPGNPPGCPTGLRALIPFF